MHKQPTEFWLIHVVVLTIICACLMMIGPMNQGLMIGEVPLEMRIQYMQENQGLWHLGWLLLMASAIGLVYFFWCLATVLKLHFVGGWSYSMVVLVALGIPADLSAKTMYAFVLPNMVASSIYPEIAVVLEKVVINLTGLLSNGLYNIGGLMLNLMLLKAGLVDRWVSLLGLPAWCFGLALSVNIATGDFVLVQVFTVLSMILSAAWMLVIAHKLFKYESVRVDKEVHGVA